MNSLIFEGAEVEHIFKEDKLFLNRHAQGTVFMKNSLGQCLVKWHNENELQIVNEKFLRNIVVD